MQPTFLPTATRLYVTSWPVARARFTCSTATGHELGTVPSEPVSTSVEIVPLNGDEILFGNTSYVDPMAWFRYDASTHKVTKTTMHQTSTVSFADFQVVRDYATSKDGTKVPITILQCKSTKLGGANPAVLNGAGYIRKTQCRSSGISRSSLHGRSGRMIFPARPMPSLD